MDSVVGRSRPGEELAELLWDNGPSLRTTTPHYFSPPFQPFIRSAAGTSSRAHELSKRHGTEAMDDGVGLRCMAPAVHHHNDDDEDSVPWLHCPVVVVDDGDIDTAPALPPEYPSAGLLSGYPPGLDAVRVPPTSGIERPSSNGAVAVPTAPLETAATQPQTNAAGESVTNFSFFSRPLQRPEASAAAAAACPSNHPVESAAAQTAASRLRNTPLFSEQRMAWLQPSHKGPLAAKAVPPQAPSSDQDDGHHVKAAATVTRHRLPADADAAAAAVPSSSVCSGNGDRSQPKMMSSHQPTAAECSVSQDEDMDDEAGAMRRPAALRGTKRSRTAEVHNLSERRRRDRINERMRALQELIPNCNKVDKASMLEEAIEYLKTLQLQVQIMMMMSSMGAAAGLCLPPMLMQVPPMAPFHHHLGMGLGFGIGAAAAQAFDVLPRLAGAHQFPFPVMPPMAMLPPGPMFGVPFAHVAGEQMEAAAAAAGGAGAAGDNPPVAVAPQGDQNQRRDNNETLHGWC